MTTPIPDWARYLAEAGRLAPSADNSQPWRFVFEDDRLRLTFDPQRGSSLGQDHPAVLLAFGCVVENLVQAAQAAGMETAHWRFGTGPDFLEIPPPAPNLQIPADVPASIRDRHTNRAPFERREIEPAIAAEIESFQEGAVRCRVFREREDIDELACLVRLASELRFQTEEIHRWLAGSLRFTEAEIARGDGLDVHTLALPPGGVLLSRFLTDWRRMQTLNRLGAHKLLARIEAAQLSQCGALIAITGAMTNPSRWLAAGRLLERLWLHLNAAGWAVQPYFVLSDQLQRLETGRMPARLERTAKKLAQRTRRLFEANARPLMLLRVGKAGNPVPRARRLPLASILVTD